MNRNALISYTKAKQVEPDAKAEHASIFYGSPFGVLVIDDKGLTTREASPSGPCRPMPSKKKYRR